jgi:hypothetical protein
MGGADGATEAREKMLSSRLKLFSLAVGVVSLFATPSLASVSQDTPTFGNTVFRPDGKIVGTDPDINVRFQLMRDSFANEN